MLKKFLLVLILIIRHSAVKAHSFQWETAVGPNTSADMMLSDHSYSRGFSQTPIRNLPSAPEESSKNMRLFHFGILPFMVRGGQQGQYNECGVEGTRCVSHGECAAKRGKVKGKCYKGFGVCCSLEVECGATIRTNETYLVNKNFPKSVTTIGNCQYNIEKMHKNICQLRFDMEMMVLAGPNLTSQCLQDTFSITGGAGHKPIVICGTNSGQHIYMDLPEGANSARINIATATQGMERNWKIKVSQIACNSPYRAPPNCLQYHEDYSGSITSFNYQPNEGVHQLASQMYTICVRSKPGFCGVTFKGTDFSLTNSGTAGVAVRPQTGDVECSTDFVSIFTASKEGIILPDRYCGNAFQDVTTFSKPFEIRVVTDNDEPTADINNRGFKLNYLQIPC